MALPRLSKPVIALIMGGASSLAIATQYTGEREGLKLEAYQDTGDVWSICYGETAGVKKGDTATKEQCDALMTTDLKKRVEFVRSIIKVPMSAPREAALASFCYNVGNAACSKSSLFKRINAGDKNACDALMSWTFVAGKDCKNPANKCMGIVTDRERLKQLCNM